MRHRSIALTLAAACALQALGTSAAEAYCSAPNPPTKSFNMRAPTKPQTPYCYNQYSQTNNCSGGEISRYNSEVDTYNRGLEEFSRQRREYAQRLEQYLSQARAYAQCEMDSMDRGY